MKVISYKSSGVCNDCQFNKYHYHNGKGTIVVEQIVKDATLCLCMYHFMFYSFRRFKWWLNEKSHYKLEDMFGKWWIR